MVERELKHIYQVQKEVSLLSSIGALLEWDQQTHMPSLGVGRRAQQMRLMSRLVHSRLTAPSLWTALKRAGRMRLKAMDGAVVRELSREVAKLRRVPADLVEELSQQTTLAHHAWEQARKANRFSHFAPHLQRLVVLQRRHAGCLNSRLRPYDALVNEFEEGMSSSKYSRVFGHLQKELRDILDSITASQTYRRQRPLRIKMDKVHQRLVTEHIAEKMTVTPDRVAVDVSAHPFTIGIGQQDVRITTRYTNALESFSDTVHESGHALYELGIPKRFRYTVLHDAPSCGLHESQSLFWEKMVARSAPFWKIYSRHFNRLAGIHHSWQQYYRGINQVRPSFIRVEADEVTYSLHIILRFEMERDLMNGALKVSELPQAWNDRFHELTGLRVRSDNRGCLQDVHWAGAAFGYFPSYCVGTVYASQLYARLLKSMPDTEELIQRLEFRPIIAWLGRKVHSKGNTILAEDIIRKACGQGLNPRVFTAYLRQKYGELYGF
jgi:carboxypeptidase Taq